jgi:N-acetylglucosaminyl-diphospho-decaprenol L-rhamnosyltransferase
MIIRNDRQGVPVSVTISIVSHGHGPLIDLLIDDLANNSKDDDIDLKLLVTKNIADEDWTPPHSGLDITVVSNPRPRGFGANHNAAFGMMDSDYFIVCNPDVRLHSEFSLTALLSEVPELGLLSPKILNEKGQLEDFYRPDLSVLNLAKRKILNVDDSNTDNACWVAGIFMVFNARSFSEVGGFDEGYFMYVEDCDICSRLSRIGGSVDVSRRVSLIHNAQRASRKSLRHMFWHISSLLLYWRRNFIFWVKS